MYIKTETALVNLRDKDIVIEPEISYRVEQGDPPFVVVALGPESGELDGFPIQARFKLYAGQKEECEAYLTGLIPYLNNPVIFGGLEEIVVPDRHIVEGYDDEIQCENCKAPLTDNLICAECGHDNIPF